MNYCEWIKCGDYTGSDCKAWGGTMKCKTQIEAEPYASAMLSARDKWWVEMLESKGLVTCIAVSNRYECNRCPAADFVCEWQSFKKEINQ
jgi:hypothetical protein